MTRALFSSYAGPLYSVNRSSDGATMDIGLLAPGGVVNSKAQDTFCAGAACIVSSIYDQTSRGNHLTISPPGGAWKHPGLPVNATRYPTQIAGSAAYAAYFETKQGYRIDKTSGVATGNEEEVRRGRLLPSRNSSSRTERERARWFQPSALFGPPIPAPSPAS